MIYLFVQVCCALVHSSRLFFFSREKKTPVFLSLSSVVNFNALNRSRCLSLSPRSEPKKKTR